MLSESYYEKITRIASKMTNNILSHGISVGVLYGLSTWQADYTSNRPIHEKLEELDEKISKLEEKK
ncbi:hypothetical protein GLOIN_2v749266 [Rhizophagus irregularis DAOM 181602=DAOM 197198]|uniref:Uncharacterized protein n=1 Tax=Rhizophagus irregularis (strain DAOM 181602 / DAOM 197198 / MUCL 43194) TaxID=747089 RepID=A0A2P4QJJ0_RHIID|nr:hypothetical protein GLOIN_2v749266 [Rhizophagus irregularis DAOM 181602=DAOM 197198]POG77804.1 hypothetical protein GLOIN_2v749266 [Rhizophagus irregularis DAOM 181602=DAOM 197198]|eukprot:XP_025184670.1 hypothetical protein GLOIN_2v749266 [Rhizophagus irregularis DAOM 181602=DAOM 197198]